MELEKQLEVRGTRPPPPRAVHCVPDMVCVSCDATHPQEARQQGQLAQRSVEATSGDVEALRSQVDKLRAACQQQSARADTAEERASQLALRVKIVEVCVRASCTVRECCCAGAGHSSCHLLVVLCTGTPLWCRRRPSLRTS